MSFFLLVAVIIFSLVFLITFLDEDELEKMIAKPEEFLVRFPIILFGIITILLSQKIILCLWKNKKIEQNNAKGITLVFLSVFFFVVFLPEIITPFLNPEAHTSVSISPSVTNEIELLFWSYIFDFWYFIIVLLWFTSWSYTAICGAFYLGVLTTKDKTIKPVSQKQIGLMQITLGISLFLSVTIGSIWIENVFVEQKAPRHVANQIYQIKEGVLADDPSAYDHYVRADVTDTIGIYTFSYTLKEFKYMALYAKFIMFILAVMLFFQGLKNIRTTESVLKSLGKSH